MRECNAPPYCAICAEDDKRNPNHRLGSYGCQNYVGDNRDNRNGGTGQ